jgi:predicted Zn finger-like uncharacterized protein
MDVGCPKCQTEYELDDARVTEDGVTVKCTTCGHVFRVKKKQLVVTLPAKADAPSESLGPPSSDLPPSPPSREWKIRQVKGNVFPCRDLTMLQKWIIEGKVVRDDEISLTGETWKRLGNIPELASFFQIVEEAAKARTMEAQQRSAPSQKITDTWKGGEFSAPPPAPAPEAETLPPEPPKKRTTPTNKQFPEPNANPPITETLQGGRFSAPVPMPPPAPPSTAVRSAARAEPSDEELKRALGKSGGGGKWLALVIAGLLVGGAVGYYFGVYEPEQKRLEEERAQAEKAKLDEEARAKVVVPPPVPVVVLDASVEEEVVDAGLEEDAGVEDAGVEVVDAGLAIVDAGVSAPVVVEPKKTFEWFLAQGDRLREREKAEASLDFYAKAAELKPQRVEPITGKGLALLDMANPSAAEAAFEQALKLNSRYGPAIIGLAEVSRIQGKTQKALEFYERYLEVLPNGAEAAVARNSIERLKR